MASLALTVRETLRYRGAIGQWAWVLHRLTGLGVVLFLFLHVIDTSWAVFYPELYVEAIASYQTPLFTIGEFGLVFSVVYHALNGLRIAIFDNAPHLWRHQERAAYGVLGLTVLILAPVFIGMIGHVINFYNTSPRLLGLDVVLLQQVPFAIGAAVAIVVAIILSGIVGVVSGGEKQERRASGSRLERFWWSFMRVSGVLILPLVFGHLAMMHVLQGVFDLTAAGHSIVGTNAVNESGTAVEFVAERWGFLLGGVAIWKIYDAGLLALATVHGFNGLRYILTDYTMHKPLLRRAATYFCALGAIVLLVLGVAALLSAIEPTAIEMAVEAAEKLGVGQN